MERWQNMKRICSIAMICILTLVLAQGCSSAKINKKSNSITKIGLVVSTLGNPFFVAMKDGAVEKANTLGYEIIVLDSQNDSTKEKYNIGELVSENIDVLLLNPTNTETAGKSVAIANTAGIPVVMLDRDTKEGDTATFISSDNLLGGKMAADFLNQILSGKGRIIELEGTAGTSAAKERGAGFHKQLKLYPKLSVIASRTADFSRDKGFSVMEKLLNTYPNIDAIFAHNDEMAIGAMKAVEESGQKVVIVGFDGIDEALKAVKTSKITATIAQQPELIGTLGVDIAGKITKGNKVEKKILVGLKLISN
jgi:ribose transport system substrate-binding protein